MPTDETLLAEMLEQEERLQLSRYDNDDAFRLGMMLVERARADGLALTVDLTRVHQQLFHVALPGTMLDNDHWVRRKTAEAQLTRRLRRAVTEGDLSADVDPADLARYVHTVSDGIAVQAASGTSRAALRRIAALALRGLPA